MPLAKRSIGRRAMTKEVSSERRRLERFSVNAFAVVETVSTGEAKVFELHTRDISQNGAFFPMEVPLPAGERVKVTLFLSISAQELQLSFGRARIATEGQVVRSEPDGMAVMFARGDTTPPQAGPTRDGAHERLQGRSS
jgi:hypothetical protein